MTSNLHGRPKPTRLESFLFRVLVGGAFSLAFTLRMAVVHARVTLNDIEKTHA